MSTAPVEFDSQAEVDRQWWVYWNRIMKNDGRDGSGDLVRFPAGEWPRKHFDPPGYIVHAAAAEQADARVAAWKSYDESMSAFWRKRIYGSRC